MRRWKAANPTGPMAAIVAVLIAAGTAVYVASGDPPADAPPLAQEELVQVLAPIALYPDSLLSQMLMASTYPLEVVQADRWVKQNPGLQGDALASALETQNWDPSVKSLVSFPQVLAMMSENLDVTVKIGDAFIAQQAQVMATIQDLRAKAQETGNLKTTPQQTVSVEQEGPTPTIVIAPADPQIVYIPTYSPDVYYSTWPYPAYPPVAYYPPGYVTHRGLSFFGGVGVGVAWGYAWGHFDWRRGNVDIDINRNTSFNARINRSRYQTEFQARNASITNGRGTFQHDAFHRQGVAYRDRKTAGQFGRVSSADVAKAREPFRGRSGPGPQALPSGTVSNRPSAISSQRPVTSNRPSAFEGVKSGGASARAESARGSVSRSSPARAAAPSRSGGGVRSGGGARSGGRR